MIGVVFIGTFDEIKDIQSEKHCVLACCQKDECNVAFMTAEKCYHITCASNELCMPVLSPKVATRNQFAMVLVRAVGDDNWENLLSKRGMINKLIIYVYPPPALVSNVQVIHAWGSIPYEFSSF